MADIQTGKSTSSPSGDDIARHGTVARGVRDGIESLLRLGVKALNLSSVRLHGQWGSEMLRLAYPPGSSLVLSDAEAERLLIRARETRAALLVQPELPPGEGRTDRRGTLGVAMLPLRAPSGAVIGSLLLAADPPRLWTDREVEAMQELAACVARELGTAEQAPPTARESRAPAESGGENQVDTPSAGGREVRAWIRSARRSGEVERGAKGEAIAAWLDMHLREALHSGHLRAGDRLPSIREVGRAVGASNYAASDAYRRLAATGLVEKRDRSGIYLAPAAPDPGPLPSETMEWMVEMLGQAVEHRLKVTHLPDLIRRWVLERPLLCACLESAEDPRFALCAELRESFGLDSVAIPLDALSPVVPEGSPLRRHIEQQIRDADILVSTSFHATTLRPIAEALQKPLVVTTVHPEIAAATERKLDQTGGLVFICVDPAFGERIRCGLRGGVYRDRIRVVLAEDDAALAALDRSDPVYLTRAAREHLGPRADFRLIAPPSPTFSPDFARSLLRVVAALHLPSPAAR